MRFVGTLGGRWRRVLFRPQLAALVLATAIAPSLLWLGHWGPFVDEHGEHSHAASGGQTSDHSNHCHDAMASCSDVPLQVVPQAEMVEAVVLQIPDETGTPLPDADSPVSQAEAAPDTPPPRAAGTLAA